VSDLDTIEPRVKLWLLKQLLDDKLKYFKTISAIYRVENSVLLIEFDRDERIYFDVSKGKNSIYKREDFIKIKRFSAPFDITLQKRFISASIENSRLIDNDKVLQIEVNSKSSYKLQKSILQIELTGKNSNIIILNDSGVVLEALRHIDLDKSYREVKPNKKLLPLPKNDFIAKEYRVGDIDSYLSKVYTKIQQDRLNSLKSQKVSQIDKSIKKLQKSLNSLDSADNLNRKAQVNYNYANIVLANIYSIKPYQKFFEGFDFEGNSIKIELPFDKPVSSMANIFFDRAKKFKQKAKNIHIEYESLSSKIEFLSRLKDAINSAKNSDEVELYMPSKKSSKKIVKKDEEFKSFVIDDYRVLMGRNEKENIKLLKNAKATDFWMHLKDRASSHIIISTKKKSLPEDVIYQAAKICVEFNTTFSGNYEVDYAKRRDVAIQNGANVLYNNYKTIIIKKD
jgi:predicted ribosome quality control (RQC) complex YloA/Tae2 family protein